MVNIMKCRGVNKIDFNSFNIIEMQCIKDCIRQSSGIIIGIPSCKIMVSLNNENKFTFKTEGYNRTLQEYEQIYFDNVKDESNGDKRKFQDVCMKMCLRAYIEECNIFFFTTVEELDKFYEKFDVIPDTEQLKDDKAAMLEVIYVPHTNYTEIQFERFLEKVVPLYAPYVDSWNVMNEFFAYDDRMHSIRYHALGYHIIKKYPMSEITDEYIVKNFGEDICAELDNLAYQANVKAVLEQLTVSK